MKAAVGRFLAPALFVTTALLIAGAGATAQPGFEPGKEKKDKLKEKEKDKGKDGPKGGPGGKASHEIRKAFDGVTEASNVTPAGKAGTRVLDHAKAFYRAAVKVYPDDPRRAGELAVAANDAVRGLEHLRRAAFQPVAGLPEPPDEFDALPPPKDGPKGKSAPPPPKDGPKDGPKGKDFRDPPAERGPWSGALAALSEVQDRLAAGDAPATGAARDFLDAAKGAYRQARTAYESGEFRKAAELARAAGAWLHVGEHLDRAEWDGPAAPLVAPEPRKGTAPPLPPFKG